jgi:hypothetical protein
MSTDSQQEVIELLEQAKLDEDKRPSGLSKDSK